MKLISLNTWGGKCFDPLMKFINNQSSTTDIFCLQEIYDTTYNVKQYKNLIRANLLDELKNILPDFQVFHFPTLFGYDDVPNPVDFDLSYGQAIFVKDSILIDSSKNLFIYKDKSLYKVKSDFSNLATPLQYISFTSDNKKFSIFHFHGTPFPPNKLDSKNRILEARKVRKIMDTIDDAKILVGDFNLLPNTQCIEIFQKNSRNLIKEFNIKRTRSNLSPFAKLPNFQKHADYTFVSKDVLVKDFQVPYMEISDHLPMILEFS